MERWKTSGRAHHVTVILGNARWDFYDREVLISREDGVVHISDELGEEQETSAPIEATVIRWTGYGNSPLGRDEGAAGRGG